MNLARSFLLISVILSLLYTYYTMVGWGMILGTPVLVGSLIHLTYLYFESRDLEEENRKFVWLNSISFLLMIILRPEFDDMCSYDALTVFLIKTGLTDYVHCGSLLGNYVWHWSAFFLFVGVAVYTIINMDIDPTERS